MKVTCKPHSLFLYTPSIRQFVSHTPTCAALQTRPQQRKQSVCLSVVSVGYSIFFFLPLLSLDFRLDFDFSSSALVVFLFSFSPFSLFFLLAPSAVQSRGFPVADPSTPLFFCRVSSPFSTPSPPPSITSRRHSRQPACTTVNIRSLYYLNR